MDHAHHIVERMSAIADARRSRRGASGTRSATRSERALAAGLWVFGAYHLLLGAFMAIAPHSFYKEIGPFGGYNGHYVRDVSTFMLALGVGLLVAVRKPSWRVPVLAVTTIQFALHSLNHLLDIGKAHPGWTGYSDFFSLAAATALLAWLLTLALAEARAAPTRQQGAPS